MNNNPVIRLYDALTRGDMAAARACFTPEATVWHNFDGIALDIETAVQGWAGLVANSQERHIEDIHIMQSAGRLVQQHMFVLRTPAGERKAWPLCVVAEIEGGRIKRFQEYIDRAGIFRLAEGAVKTPGF